MKKYLAALVVAISALAIPAGANADLCAKAQHVRTKVVHMHGKRAPGRDICRYGVHARMRWTYPDGTRSPLYEPPSHAQKLRYLHQLRRLVHPVPYMSTTAVPPRLAPAGTASAGLAPTGTASCIVSHESHGDPGATNGQYGGIAQWSPEAWARMGGTRYATTPQGASYQQQLQVLSDGLAKFGCRDFCPYDGC